MYDESLMALKTGEEIYADAAFAKQDIVLEQDMRMRREHMKRVAAGECDPSHRSSFMKIINEIDRIANSCVSIAETVASKRVDLTFFVTEQGIEQASETLPRELV